MKIAIVGGAPSTEMLAPFDDSSWDIWVLGVRANIYSRVDRIFEIHEDLGQRQDKTPVKDRKNAFDADYCKKLVALERRLIVGDSFPIESGNVTKFPYQEAIELFGSQYLTSSCAYMMAYAILMDATEIALYGIDMAVDDDEYFYQRPCMEAWIGFAKGRGIKVTIPDGSALGKASFIYGKNLVGDINTGIFNETEFTKLALQHQSKMDELECRISQLKTSYTAHDGCKQAYERMAKTARAVQAGVEIKSLTQTVSLKG